jgi:PDZ domain-containing secreted protein
VCAHIRVLGNHQDNDQEKESERKREKTREKKRKREKERKREKKRDRQRERERAVLGPISITRIPSVIVMPTIAPTSRGLGGGGS